MKTDEQYLAEANRELAVLLGEEPPASRSGPSVSRVSNDMPLIVRKMDQTLVDLGYLPGIWCQQMPFRDVMSFRHKPSGFEATYSELFASMGPRHHPAARFMRDLLKYLGREETDAREVYQDPHIVRL